MPQDDPQIQLSTASLRQSRRDRIAEVIQLARDRKDPLRIRLPFTLYDYKANRGYAYLRDSTWNITLPSEELTPEQVENLIGTIDRFMIAVANHGSGTVDELLRGLPDTPIEQGEEPQP